MGSGHCVSASRLTLRKPLHTPRKSGGVVAQKTVAREDGGIGHPVFEVLLKVRQAQRDIVAMRRGFLPCAGLIVHYLEELERNGIIDDIMKNECCGHTPRR